MTGISCKHSEAFGFHAKNKYSTAETLFSVPVASLAKLHSPSRARNLWDGALRFDRKRCADHDAHIRRMSVGAVSRTTGVHQVRFSRCFSRSERSAEIF